MHESNSITNLYLKQKSIVLHWRILLLVIAAVVWIRILRINFDHPEGFILSFCTIKVCNSLWDGQWMYQSQTYLCASSLPRRTSPCEFLAIVLHICTERHRTFAVIHKSHYIISHLTPNLLKSLSPSKEHYQKSHFTNFYCINISIFLFLGSPIRIFLLLVSSNAFVSFDLKFTAHYQSWRAA